MHTRKRKDLRLSGTRSTAETIAFLEEVTGGPLTFGRMLSALRMCDEISQVEFARRLDISKQHLCDIEKGRKSVSPERAAFFARTLGQSEKFFVKVALQDQVSQAGLHMKIEVA